MLNFYRKRTKCEKSIIFEPKYIIKILKNIIMKTFKKLLVLLGIVAIVAVSAINYKLGSADYKSGSTSLLTLEALALGETGGGSSESCLVNQSSINGRKKAATTSPYCYKDRSGADLFCGYVYTCVPLVTATPTPCIASSCSGNGCYTSNQAPASDNMQ
jgi:hypothetical protein